MDFVTLLSFFGAIFIFMATPGPGVLAVVSRALGSGFSYAICMSAGMVLGDIVFLSLSLFGLSVIASKYSTLFLLIKVAGGLYLLYIGWKIVSSKTSYFDLEIKKRSSYIGDFLAGLFITLGNPKVIAFYVGFLPTFFDFSKMDKNSIITIVSVVLLTLGTILTFYSYFAVKAKELIKEEKNQRILNLISGFAMSFVGAFLIYDSIF